MQPSKRYKLDDDTLKNQSYVKNLIDLNDDCLLEIFEYLKVADQNRVRRICPRFNAIIQQLWRKTKILHINHELVTTFFQYSWTDIEDYLEIVSGIVVNVTSYYVERSAFLPDVNLLYNVLQRFNFSNAEELSLSCFVEHVPLLRSFPNLKKLTLEVNINEKNRDSSVPFVLTNQNALRKLESLNISGYTSKILPNGICKLQNLREIFIALEDYCNGWPKELSEMSNHIHTFAGRLGTMDLFTMPDVKVLKVPLLQKSWESELLWQIGNYKKLEILYIYGRPYSDEFISKFENVLAKTRALKEPLRVKFIQKGHRFYYVYPTIKSKFINLSGPDIGEDNEILSLMYRILLDDFTLSTTMPKMSVEEKVAKICSRIAFNNNRNTNRSSNDDDEKHLRTMDF
uniref:F-box domain-containing protein n=1 Tax=Glossina brevipalpis TaxID=37001 RepID=A0A1A9X4H6_9MUSC